MALINLPAPTALLHKDKLVRHPPLVSAYHVVRSRPTGAVTATSNIFAQSESKILRAERNEGNQESNEDSSKSSPAEEPQRSQSGTQESDHQKVYQVKIQAYSNQAPSLKDFVLADKRRTRLVAKYGLEMQVVAKAKNLSTLSFRGSDPEKFADVFNDILEEAENEGVKVLGRSYKTPGTSRFRIMVPSELAASIIGPKGIIIQAIIRDTGALLRLQSVEKAREYYQNSVEPTMRLLDIAAKSRDQEVSAFRSVIRRMASNDSFGKVARSKST